MVVKFATKKEIVISKMVKMKSKGENAFFFLISVLIVIYWSIYRLDYYWSIYRLDCWGSAVDLRTVVGTGNQKVTFILSNLCMINFFWFFMCEWVITSHSKKYQKNRKKKKKLYTMYISIKIEKKEWLVINAIVIKQEIN